MKSVSVVESSRFPPNLYRAVFDQHLDSFLLLDTGGTIVDVNSAACQQLGYMRDQLLQSDIYQILDTASSERFSHHLKRVITDGDASLDVVHIHQDGRHIPVNLRLHFFEHNGHQLIMTSSHTKVEQPQFNIEYEKIIQATGEGYWMVNVQDARIIDTNETFCQMVGYSREELLSMSIADLEVIESEEETAAHIRKIMENGHDIFETKHRHKEGHIVEFEISVSYADIRGGAIFVFVRDISERKRQEESLQLASLVVNESSASVMVTDAENSIVSVNPAFTQITGYQPHEVIGKKPNLLSSGKQNRAFYNEMWQILLQTGHWEGEWWNRRRNGEEYAEQVILNLLRNKNGEVFRYVKIATDITEKRRLDDLVWYQANYDGITALPNRRLFIDRLTHELKKCNRTREFLAVFYIDLDNFKEVNDEHGHEVGDMLLADAARRIASCTRNTDTVARLGGDEFALLLTNLADASRIDAVANNINHILAQPFRLHNIIASISSSIGIAISPNDGSNMNDLLRKADHAMYQAKRNGKNRYNYWGMAE